MPPSRITPFDALGISICLRASQFDRALSRMYMPRVGGAPTAVHGGQGSSAPLASSTVAAVGVGCSRALASALLVHRHAQVVQHGDDDFHRLG